MLDIKKDFPIFENYPGLVYLDSAASAQKPGVVIETMREVMELQYANVHRGLYPLSEDLTERFEEVREKVRQFIGARSMKEIIFTKNATEALNLVAYSWGLDNLGKGDVIVVTDAEHHSNYLPWLYVAEQVGAELVSLPVDKESYKLEINTIRSSDSDVQSSMSLLELVERYGERIKLIAVGQVSNVLGTVNDVKEVVRFARSVGAKVVVDGCQAAAHMAVDVQKLDVDFYAFSGHKLYGPTGVGVLYGKRDLLEYMRPFMYGGEMVLQVQDASSKKQLGRNIWKELPWKFEAGTMPIVEVVGLGEAIDYINRVKMVNIVAHERDLMEYMLKRLKEVDGLKLVGIDGVEGRVGAFSFTLDGVHAHDVAQVLGEMNVCVRAGHHCAQVLHRSLGMEATVRVSLGVYSDSRDVDALVGELMKVREKFLG